MMVEHNKRDSLVFEVMLLVVASGMAFLLYRMGVYKMVVLNLFFLPIVLAGYYLGRTSAGVLALFSVLAATIAATLDMSNFVTHSSPVLVALVLSVWGATLGLTAILLGTLCDERTRTLSELHVAYVGVVEVVAKYLQSANPTVKARATRIAELSQEIATRMRLPQREIDDIRVAALLYDLGNVEITTRLLTRAVDTLEANPDAAQRHTFSGMDLVHSLGGVLSGAMPLLVTQDCGARELLVGDGESYTTSMPIGARIIRAARAYDALINGLMGDRDVTPGDALRELRGDVAAAFDENVLAALGQVLQRGGSAATRVPALV